jgi:hypothetical protein
MLLIFHLLKRCSERYQIKLFYVTKEDIEEKELKACIQTKMLREISD